MGACCKATLGQHHKGLHIAHSGCIAGRSMWYVISVVTLALGVGSCKSHQACGCSVHV